MKKLLFLLVFVFCIGSTAGCVELPETTPELTTKTTMSTTTAAQTTTTIIPTTTVTVTTTKVPTTTAIKTTIKAVTTTQKSSTVKTTIEKNKQMVWIPTSGSKYHTYSGCSNMKNPSQIPLSEAQQLGYTACKRCH